MARHEKRAQSKFVTGKERWTKGRKLDGPALRRPPGQGHFTSLRRAELSSAFLPFFVCGQGGARLLLQGGKAHIRRFSVEQF